MPVHAVVTLNTLRCIAESDRRDTSHSEPYVWPFLASFTSNSRETMPTSASLDQSRKLIRSEMRAGQSAPLAFPGNRLMAPFGDDQIGRELVLIVALLEQDDTPRVAIQAGYQAFLDNLRLELFQHVFALRAATGEEQTKIIDGIRDRVKGKVTAAIEGALTTTEKLSVALGLDSPDDFLGFAHMRLSGSAPADFTLNFTGLSGDRKVVRVGEDLRVVDFPIAFAIDGKVRIEPVVIDPCQAQVEAVTAAQAGIDSLRAAVAGLQASLQTASPAEKVSINKSIVRIQTVDKPAAEKKLNKAKRALADCRIVAA